MKRNLKGMVSLCRQNSLSEFKFRSKYLTHIRKCYTNKLKIYIIVDIQYYRMQIIRIQI